MLYMELTRYEVRECKYCHSGFVCGGAEWMENYGTNEEYLDFIGLMYDLGEDPDHGFNPPNFNEINYDGRSREKMLCFFTNEGLHRCEPIIKKMLDILRKNGAVIDTLKYIVEIPVTDSNIVYRDQYQAIVYWEG